MGVKLSVTLIFMKGKKYNMTLNEHETSSLEKVVTKWKRIAILTYTGKEFMLRSLRINDYENFV